MSDNININVMAEHDIADNLVSCVITKVTTDSDYDYMTSGNNYFISCNQLQLSHVHLKQEIFYVYLYIFNCSFVKIFAGSRRFYQTKIILIFYPTPNRVPPWPNW